MLDIDALQLVGDVVSRPYIHLTIAMLARFGIEIDVHPHHFVIRGGQSYQSPQHYWVEGDASAASYWLAAAAIAVTANGAALLVSPVLGVPFVLSVVSAAFSVTFCVSADALLPSL